MYASASWVFAGKLTARLLGLIRVVVLARLLTPEDFGLFGIILLAMATLRSFSRTGMRKALIQRKDITRADLDTAWTVNVLRAGLLAVLLFLGAPLVGWAFNEARVVAPLRVMCVSLLLGSLANIGTVYFHKDLAFSKEFGLRALASIISLVVGVALAYQLRSVWALVWAGLVQSGCSCILSYAFHPYRPRFSFNFAVGKPLFSFGKFVFAQSIVLFFVTKGDDLFVGAFLGASALGLYRMAYRFSNLAATELTHTVSAVVFPAYSLIQDDKGRLADALRSTFRAVSLVVLPLSGATFALAPEFTEVVLGPRWMAMVPSIRILCVFGAIRSLAATFGPCYAAQGRLDRPLTFNVVQMTLLAAFVYPLSSAGGIAGTSTAVTLAALPLLYLTGKEMSGLLGTRITTLLEPAVTPSAATVCMIAALLFASPAIPRSALGLAALSVVGALVYASALMLLSEDLRGHAVRVATSCASVQRLWGRRRH